MSHYLTALTGAGTTIAVGLTYLARSLTRIEPASIPSGRHRGRPDEAIVPLAETDPVDRFKTYCPAEGRRTEHVWLHAGGELCVECRNRGLAAGGEAA